jgi:hypothetical protein
MFAHKNLKRFYLEGEIYDDSKIPALKDQYVLLLHDIMTSKGYVPRYDVDMDFTLEYNGKTFEFKMSIYGVFVGKKKAICLKGIAKNRPIANTTQAIKLAGF